MKRLMMRGLMAISLSVALVGGAKAGDGLADRAKSDPAVVCAEMMRESSPEGRTAMEPQAMANMMEMARRMGGGDAVLGMTRMMEMMGSMGGGMMGGQRSMMEPGGSRPGK